MVGSQEKIPSAPGSEGKGEVKPEQMRKPLEILEITVPSEDTFPEEVSSLLRGEKTEFSKTYFSLTGKELSEVIEEGLEEKDEELKKKGEKAELVEKWKRAQKLGKELRELSKKKLSPQEKEQKEKIEEELKKLEGELQEPVGEIVKEAVEEAVVRELIEGKEARETEEKEVFEGEKPVPKEERLKGALDTILFTFREKIEKGEQLDKAEVEEFIKEKFPQEQQKELLELFGKFGDKIGTRELWQVVKEKFPGIGEVMERILKETTKEFGEKLAESERQREELVRQNEELARRIKELEAQLAQRPPAPRPAPQKVGWSKRLGDWWENKVPDAIKAALTLGGAMTGIGITWGGFLAFGATLPALFVAIGGVGVVFASLRFGFGTWGPREREELREWAREELRRMVGPPPEAAPRAEIPPPPPEVEAQPPPPPEVGAQPAPSGPEAPTQVPPTAVSEAVPKAEVPPAPEGKEISDPVRVSVIEFVQNERIANSIKSEELNEDIISSEFFSNRQDRGYKEEDINKFTNEMSKNWGELLDVKREKNLSNEKFFSELKTEKNRIFVEMYINKAKLEEAEKENRIGIFYLNLKLKHWPKFIREFTEKCLGEDVAVWISTPAAGIFEKGKCTNIEDFERSDRVEIHFDLNDAEKILKILRGIYKKEYFYEEIPRFTERVKKGVGFGEGPLEKESFGGLRSKILMEIWNEIIKEAKAQGLSSEELIEMARSDFSEFCKKFNFVSKWEEACKKYQVDPENPAFNLREGKEVREKIKKLIASIERK